MALLAPTPGKLVKLSRISFNSCFFDFEDFNDTKIVNETENQAAWHPKYKKRKPNINNPLTKLIEKVCKNKKPKKIPLTSKESLLNS